MRNALARLLIAAVVVVFAGCVPGPRSPSGFRLPPTGDVARGQATFLTFGCNECHEVAGATLPPTNIRPPVLIRLGGMRPEPMTDGYLVTSIIYPSHRNGESRMPHFADRMTVQQVVDLVAFLQSRYTVQPRWRSRWARPSPMPVYEHLFPR